MVILAECRVINKDIFGKMEALYRTATYDHMRLHFTLKDYKLVLKVIKV